MQAQILAHRKAIQQALSLAHSHAEQLTALVVPHTCDIDNPSEVPTEDRPVRAARTQTGRLPFDIQCLIDSVSVDLPVTIDGQAAYRKAKAAFDQFDGFSCSRPDSLTRRGDVLIARRVLSNGRSYDRAIDEWQELVEELFSGQVVIYDTSIDAKNNLRVHFSLVNGASEKAPDSPTACTRIIGAGTPERRGAMLFFSEPEELAGMFQLEPTKPNIGRIKRAIRIVDAKQVKFIGLNGHLREYSVHPQGVNPKMHNSDGKYIVRANGGNYPTCTCPDWRHENKKLPPEVPICTHRCKHGIAVMLYERLNAEE